MKYLPLLIAPLMVIGSGPDTPAYDTQSIAVAPQGQPIAGEGDTNDAAGEFTAVRKKRSPQKPRHSEEEIAEAVSDFFGIDLEAELPYGGTYLLVLVLFILLVIIGAGFGSGGGH